MNERPLQRDTQVKRQLAIDCGQKGFRYISYCRYASSIDLRGEINVLQDCLIYLFTYFLQWQVVRVDLERKVDFARVCGSAPHRHRRQAVGGGEGLK